MRERKGMRLERAEYRSHSKHNPLSSHYPRSPNRPSERVCRARVKGSVTAPHVFLHFGELNVYAAAATAQTAPVYQAWGCRVGWPSAIHLDRTEREGVGHRVSDFRSAAYRWQRMHLLTQCAGAMPPRVEPAGARLHAQSTLPSPDHSAPITEQSAHSNAFVCMTARILAEALDPITQLVLALVLMSEIQDWVPAS